MIAIEEKALKKRNKDLEILRVESMLIREEDEGD